jgi:mannan endo-1,4-beta-mannosidase
VWQSLFNYFSNEKNLHNLLWVYAPDQGPGNHTLYYPGEDYVDIVALDVYVDDPVILNNFFSY